MWKTFFASPALGGLAAVLGWVAAVVFRSSMSEAEFAEIAYGWNGAMIGGIAIATLVMLTIASEMVEPLVMAVSAGVGAFFLWDYREFPVTSTNFNGTTAAYWFMFGMMALIFLLLLIGLRGARNTPR